MTWADADLTASGIQQANIANAFWKSRIALQKIPFPQSYYTSPLTRCLRTANITFSDLDTPYYYGFEPTVKEFFREGISTHTCDRRGTKSKIHSRFPTYDFEAGFTENDELWNSTYAETSSAQDIRSKTVLDSVFKDDDHTWISVTSHSGEIASLLRVLGHRSFSLSTGAIIPVLVKADVQYGVKAVTSSVGPSRTSSRYCTNGPPITSISTGTQGCICTGVSSALASSSKPTTSLSASKSASRSTGILSSTTSRVSSTGRSSTSAVVSVSASKSACKLKKSSSVKA